MMVAHGGLAEGRKLWRIEALADIMMVDILAF
jgi:hypothetical protein